MQLSKPRVIIIGAGSGGLSAAKALDGSDTEVILIDRNNHHLFQPLLYQVATSALSPGDIAMPIRTELRNCRNIQVIMNEATSVDRRNNKVWFGDECLEYDYLILAPGARHSYFGHDDWEKTAPGLKTLQDALVMREKILTAFENAERHYKKPDAEKHTNFVIVGGGPTGVELAGAIDEISLKTMLKDYPLLKRNDIHIYLIDAGARLLSSYSQDISDYTKATLEKMGVKVLLDTKVLNVNAEGVETDKGYISTANVIWAAGNKASALLKTLETETDGAGRVKVMPDMSVHDSPDVFVIGDGAYLEYKGAPLPGIAPVAMQQGRYVAGLIKNRKKLQKRPAFRYFDKGSMATIGRAKAVAVIGTFRFKGFFAWTLWGLVHIMFLIDFRNRFRVFSEWIWYYITFRPGARLIYGTRKT